MAATMIEIMTSGPKNTASPSVPPLQESSPLVKHETLRPVQQKFQQLRQQTCQPRHHWRKSKAATAATASASLSSQSTTLATSHQATAVVTLALVEHQSLSQEQSQQQ